VVEDEVIDVEQEVIGWIASTPMGSRASGGKSPVLKGDDSLGVGGDAGAGSSRRRDGGGSDASIGGRVRNFPVGT
jgi:hypothetical protein